MDIVTIMAICALIIAATVASIRARQERKAEERKRVQEKIECIQHLLALLTQQPGDIQSPDAHTIVFLYGKCRIKRKRWPGNELLEIVYADGTAHSLTFNEGIFRGPALSANEERAVREIRNILDRYEPARTSS